MSVTTSGTLSPSNSKTGKYYMSQATIVTKIPLLLTIISLYLLICCITANGNSEVISKHALLALDHYGNDLYMYWIFSSSTMFRTGKNQTLNVAAALR